MNKTILFLILLSSGCSVNDTPQGGIPTISFDESIEGTDTLVISSSSSYQMKHLTLPPLQRSFNIGDLVEIKFDNATLSLLDTTQLLSFIDSVFVELTDDSKTFVLNSSKIDSTFGHEIVVPHLSYYPIQEISKMGLSENKPQIRYRLRNSTRIGSSLRVRMLFKLGHVTGYVA